MKERESAVAERSPPALAQYLKPLMRLMDGGQGITEVCVNTPGVGWVEAGGEWASHSIEKLSFKHCLHLANLIANFNKQKISTDNPYLSGILPGRERVQVVIPPAVQEGAVSITIRKPSEVDFTLDELEASGSFDAVKTDVKPVGDVDKELLRLKSKGDIKGFLKLAVEQKKNILIAGSTGSGKTTVMKSLAKCIPESERVITIEDAHELFMHGFPNKVHLFYKSDSEKANAQAAIKSCLRMKPDRILLAELRGSEVWDYLDSLNSGHPGSLSSIHANSALDTFNRLTSLIKMSAAGQNLPPEYIQQMCFESIDIVLYFERKRMKELYFDPKRKEQAARVELRAA